MLDKDEVFLSIIVPFHPEEKSGESLIRFFLPKLLAIKGELIAVGPQKPSWFEEVENLSYWQKAPLGRASQLNEGARIARGHFVWFIHADTKFQGDGFTAAIHTLKNQSLSQRALYYADLCFNADDLKTMKINEWGVKVRSDYLKMPFGDQALLIRRNDFLDLGQFQASSRGEDHLFVWTARRAGFDVLPLGCQVQTSARKYLNQGWLRTTLRHLYLTYSLALPQWVFLKRESLRKKV